MNIWEILQIIWEKKIRKGLYPYSPHWARDRYWAGPAARVAGRRRRCPRGVRLHCRDTGDVEPASTCQRGPVAGPLTSGARLSGSSSTSRAGATGDRGGVRCRPPALQGVSSDALPTGVLRGPSRVQPWVVRSPRGTGSSKASTAADEADGGDAARRNSHGEEGEKHGRVLR